MNHSGDSSASVSRFLEVVKQALAAHPGGQGNLAIARCPGAADVMGGIVEDSGALVVTSTIALAITAAVWPLPDDHVRTRLLLAAGNAQAPTPDFVLPAAAFDPGAGSAAALLSRCRASGAEWAAPTCLSVRQAIANEMIPRPFGGLMILLQTDFPPEADLGKRWVQAAVTIDGLCRSFGAQADPLAKSRACAEAVAPITGLYNLRTPMTALCGPPDGALLQLRFHPQVLCQALELPPGIAVTVADVRLRRPTSPQRLIDTHLCAEMGCRLITELQQIDGARVDAAGGKLAAITPAEYVDRYRNRLPQKITGRAFTARFGTMRGLNGEPDPQQVYKVRSRTEHHIYENRRVHDFATDIARARRTNSLDALTHAGELMYASHWSHSQRCGIGGVEADTLVTAIRRHGPEAGLFGAKVTAGGDGGELVLLMRDDRQARDALADAIARTEAAAQQPVRVCRGPMPGAEYFQPPALDALLAPAGIA
jgi:galactokinase